MARVGDDSWAESWRWVGPPLAVGPASSCCAAPSTAASGKTRVRYWNLFGGGTAQTSSMLCASSAGTRPVRGWPGLAVGALPSGRASAVDAYLQRGRCRPAVSGLGALGRHRDPADPPPDQQHPLGGRSHIHVGPPVMGVETVQHPNYR